MNRHANHILTYTVLTKEKCLISKNTTLKFPNLINIVNKNHVTTDINTYNHSRVTVGTIKSLRTIYGTYTSDGLLYNIT